MYALFLLKASGQGEIPDYLEIRLSLNSRLDVFPLTRFITWLTE
jgi:hypothetical protein